MATISTDATGLKRLQFTGIDNERKTIYLGRISKKDAETVRRQVEALLHAKICGTSPDRETSLWLASLIPKLKLKIAKHGLIDGIELPVATKKISLKDFFTKYVSVRGAGQKPGTIEVWETAIASLIEFLPKDATLQQIHAGNAVDWLDSMRKAKKNGQPRYELTTIYKRIGFARQFFGYAVKSKVIPTNPFSEISIPRPKKKSNVEVPRDQIEKLFKVCDPTWKAIVTLCRFGGLRCPSEVLTLRWQDIDTEKGTMTILAPKNEHHDGGGVRVCPLFPEVRSAIESLPRVDEYVIDKPIYRAKANTPKGWRNVNLRTQFLKLLEKADVKPWPRLFHSMRASCQTELEGRFGLPAACAWLGNTESVARESYLLVFSDKWKEAITPKSDAKSDATQPNTTNHN